MAKPEPAKTARTEVWRACLFAVVAVCTAAALPAGAARAATELTAVDAGSLPGNRTQLRFTLSQPGTAPTHFSTSEPARIVLDLPGAKDGMNVRRQDIGNGVAERVSIIEASDRTRVLVNLSRMVPYSVRTEGSEVLLTLEPAGSTPVARTESSPAQPAGGVQMHAASRSPAAAGNREVSRIDFHRGAEGQGQIIVSLGDASTSVDVREEGDRIIADFIGAPLASSQLRRLDVTDFGTPVMSIDGVNKGRNGSLGIKTNGRYELVAFQTEGKYTIEVRPATSAGSGGSGSTIGDQRERTYRGELLSLNFQDIEVRAVLQIIADFTNLNVVVSDTVTGRITLRLKNVPWDQALDIIMQTKGLTQRQQGNVIYIAPTAEVTQREKLELEARKQQVELAPLRSELMQINYAKAADIAKLIKTRSEGGGSTAGRSTETSLLSERGQVAVDDRTNTLLIQDLPERISDIRALVTRIDIPVRQVMIDSRIVIANDDFSKELGVRIGGTSITTSGSKSAILGGNIAGINNGLASFTSSGTYTTTLTDRLGFDAAVTGSPAGSLGLAILGSRFQLDLELSALQAEGRGETLSNPRVMTADRKEASIKQGREVPYTAVSNVGGASTNNVSFKEALLELTVTPQITPDKAIIMDIKVTKNEVTGEVVQGQPVLAKREVSTQVLVRSGETVVLGGVYEQITSESVDKIPFLGDIPGIGRLFRRNASSNTKSELLIFITPQIVDGNVVIH